MSNATAFFAPILFCTMLAVDGKNMSGVTVPTIIMSMASGFMPAISMALLAALIERSDVASSSAATLLSFIPVRSIIHSSEVLTIFSRSKFVRTLEGA